MGFFSDIWTVFSTDLRLELRRVDGLASMVFLAAVVSFILALAFLGDLGSVSGAGTEGAVKRIVGPGVLWVATVLAGTVGLGRILQRERSLGGWTALMLAPVSRTAIYLGKCLILLVLLLLTNAVIAPLILLLFDLDLPVGRAPELVLLVFLGSLGFALVAMLLGAIALRAKTGELLLGAIIYPVLVPLLVGGVKGTLALMSGEPFSALQPWVSLMVLTDAMYFVFGLWIFESLASEM